MYKYIRTIRSYGYILLPVTLLYFKLSKSTFHASDDMLNVNPLALVVHQRIKDSLVVIPTLRGAAAVAGSLVTLGAGGGVLVLAAPPSWFHSFMRWTPDQPPSFSLMARVLFVPSLVEEIVWRVMLQPPTMGWSGRLLVNAAFAVPYHWCIGEISSVTGTGATPAAQIFKDPAFQAVAFVLGNLCSFAYVQAGHGVWAPVMVHSIAVSLWLSYFGGENLLLGRRKGE